jgi:hypothetical protein
MEVIQGFELEARIMRYELTDYEWHVIRPMLPNKSRGAAEVFEAATARAARLRGACPSGTSLPALVLR